MLYGRLVSVHEKQMNKGENKNIFRVKRMDISRATLTTCLFEFSKKKKKERKAIIFSLNLKYEIIFGEPI